MTALLASLVFVQAAFTEASILHRPEPGEVVVLDTATGVTCTYTSGLPRSYFGIPIAVADPGVPLAISGLEVYFVALGQQNWEDVRVRVQFWEYMNPGLDPLFSTPAGPLQAISIGARQYVTGTFVETIRFTTPVTFQTTSYHGLALNIQGRINGEYVDTDALTPCLRLGAPFAVGSVALTPTDYGYFRGTFDRAPFGMDPFNFLQSEWRSLGNYSAMMLKLYARGPVQPRAFLPMVER